MAPLAVNCPPCQGVQTAVGNAYDATFVATGGQGPYSYHVQAGRLPPGISLDTATGADAFGLMCVAYEEPVEARQPRERPRARPQDWMKR